MDVEGSRQRWRREAASSLARREGDATVIDGHRRSLVVTWQLYDDYEVRTTPKTVRKKTISVTVEPRS